MSCAALWFERLSRKKIIDDKKVGDSNLKRCLGLFDLTALGVGTTLGLGIYVTAGKVAKDNAGPSVVIAFFIAGIASVFAGLCYAEFASRVPRAGSAYIYSYITVGEFIAFVIGWNLILEYVIGAASVARGYSGYLDSMMDGAMTTAFRKVMPMNVNGLSAYPDFFAFGITVALSVLLAVGVQESTKVNNVLTVLNILVVIYVIIVGATKCDVDNWKIPKSEIPNGVDGGSGGFIPFGISGMVAGAATCFYGFVGFDCVATTGEEAKNPQKNIPLAIVISLLIIFLAYCGVSIVVTMMIPYYDEDIDAPLPHAFTVVGYPVARWIVTIGALFGLSTSLLGGMFPLPRILYAMANDGLIFRWLSNINRRFKTPFWATIIAGVFAGALALIFDVDALMDMMSIGTLLAYTLVAASVLILRYKPYDKEIENDNPSINNVLEVNVSASTAERDMSTSITVSVLTRQMLYIDRPKRPTELSSTIAVWSTLTTSLFLVAFNAVVIFAYDYYADGVGWAIALLVIFGVLGIANGVIVALQPPNRTPVAFMVPWVPFIPFLSILVNVHLMLKLSVLTWLRFAVWMAIGFIIYFFYGIFQSSEEYKRKGKIPPNELNFARDSQQCSDCAVNETEAENVDVVESSSDKSDSLKPNIETIAETIDVSECKLENARLSESEINTTSGSDHSSISEELPPYSEFPLSDQPEHSNPDHQTENQVIARNFDQGDILNIEKTIEEHLEMTTLTADEPSAVSQENSEQN